MFQHGLIQLLVGDSAPFVFSERMISLLQVLANLTSPPEKKHTKTPVCFVGFSFRHGSSRSDTPQFQPTEPPKKIRPYEAMITHQDPLIIL